MPIDPNIILGIKAPQIQQRDPLETAQKSLAIKALMGQGELQRMQVDQARRGMEDENAVREAYRQSGGDSDTLRRLLTERGSYKQIQELDKFALDRDAKLATIDKDKATAGKTRYDVAIDKIQRGASILSTARDQATYDAARQSLAQTLGPKIVASMPPQFDPNFVATKIAEGQTVTQRLQDEREREKIAATGRRDAVDAANKPFNADGTPNAPVQRFQIGKSRAGAPVNNISLSTEKKYGEQFAGKVADADVSLREAAQKSPEIADRSNRIIAALDSGKVITGAGADARLAIGKALGLGGASDQETIANTEMLGRELAAGTLAAIRTSGLGAGNGFSNADREFLAKAEGGTLTMDAQTLRRAAQLAHKAAAATSERWNKRASEIPRSAVEGTGVSMEPVQVAPLSAGAAPGAPKEFNSMPDPAQYSGRRMKGEDGTIYKSDGKRWVRGG